MKKIILFLSIPYFLFSLNYGIKSHKFVNGSDWNISMTGLLSSKYTQENENLLDNYFIIETYYNENIVNFGLAFSFISKDNIYIENSIAKILNLNDDKNIIKGKIILERLEKDGEFYRYLFMSNMIIYDDEKEIVLEDSFNDKNRLINTLSAILNSSQDILIEIHGIKFSFPKEDLRKFLTELDEYEYKAFIKNESISKSKLYKFIDFQYLTRELKSIIY